MLVTADHGHSPYIDKSLRAGNGKAPRYLALGKHDAVPEGFIEIDLAGLGGPPERRAFAWRSGAYLGGPQVGFHGGCGLEEVVVPLAWIERDGLHADEPTWWYGRGTLAEASVELRPVAPPIVTPLPSDEIQPKPKAQLSLFNPADKAGSLPLPPALLERLSVDEKSILVLLRENGSARVERARRAPEQEPGPSQRSHARSAPHAPRRGAVLFTDEVLPSGETMYRYQAKEAR